MDSSVPHAQIVNELEDYKEQLSLSEEAPLPVQLATEYIHDHLFNPRLTVTRVREHLGLTGATFSSRFRRHHGHTPASYIRHLRVKAAQHLLQRLNTLPIADIAFHIGYEHYRSFARVFKRVTDCSPRAFRERIDGT